MQIDLPCHNLRKSWFSIARATYPVEPPTMDHITLKWFLEGATLRVSTRDARTPITANLLSVFAKVDVVWVHDMFIYTLAIVSVSSIPILRFGLAPASHSHNCFCAGTPHAPRIEATMKFRAYTEGKRLCMISAFSRRSKCCCYCYVLNNMPFPFTRQS